ncbi:DUF2490 domain-containing protein [Desulfococcaceae bacterium HSG9]|nr:DUF2490 domain-containing protein [Desulfococcaceae bacterium HSG9]
MRKLFFSMIAFLFTVTTLHAGQADINVDRTQLWSNLIYKAKITQSGFGVFTRYASRYNTDFDKEVNGVTKDDETQGSWLNDLFIGPSFVKKFSPRFKLFTSPQYRPMFFYLDEAKDADPESYVEHTIHWPTVLSYKTDFMTLSYRLILWNRFETDFTQGGKEIETDNEFLTRHNFGVSIPVHKKVNIDLSEEIFLLHTADDGQETFWRNALWGGVTIKPGVKGLAVKLGYVHFLTFKEDSLTRDIDVNDHHFTFSLVYSMDFSKKKK